MILSGNEIREQVNQGNITIEPFNEKNINPNSYNYRIGSEIFEIVNKVIDPKKAQKIIKIKFDEKGLVLKPNKLYLARTLETIGSERFVTSLIGRSSVGRLGLFLQITADLGQLGDSHCWTLELNVVQPIRIYPEMIIGQVSFWKTSNLPNLKYREGYTKYSLPHESYYYKEFTKENDK